MPAVHQVVAHATPVDHVTAFALELRALLRGAGESEVFALDGAEDRASGVRAVARLRGVATDVLVYHVDAAGRGFAEAIAPGARPLLVVHHDAAAPDAVAQLGPLAARTPVAVGTSDAAVLRLRAAGFERVHHVPPVLDPGRLRAIAPDPSTRHHLAVAFDAPLLVSIGPFSAGSGMQRIVAATHIATTYLAVSSPVVLLGADADRAHLGAVREQIRELALPTAHAVGPVDAHQLRAYCDAASAVVVPPGVDPWAARVPDALAAGLSVLSLPSGSGADLYAEAMAAALRDGGVGDQLLAADRRALVAVDRDSTSASFLRALLEVA